MAGINTNNDKVKAYSGNSATDRGTRIVKAGQEMDKNAFLRILSAQLSNQDPNNTQDSTALVTQLAQFASMEQMANLNDTMTGFASHSLIGKGVSLKVVDADGKPVSGIVRGVTKINGETILGVEVSTSNGTKLENFTMSDVDSVLDVNDFRLDSILGNSGIVAGSAMIGKYGEFTVNEDGKEKTYRGQIKGITKSGALLKAIIKLENGEEKTLPLETVKKISDSKIEEPKLEEGEEGKK